MSIPTFGVYVHWPYCARICPYCDFNVHRARGQDPAELIAAIAADLREHRARLGPRMTETVFLGGGTPSLLSGPEVAALLEAVDVAFPLTADAEITLEANPEDRSRYAEHVAAGVNRISIGVQALRDDALKALFRLHDAAGGLAAVATAAATGARVSADLIYARDGQSIVEWRVELAEALALPVEHLSLYQLTIEPGTAFARAAGRGRIVVPAADAAADFYEETQALTAAAGLPAYEISNHARGGAARARHNLLYWTTGEWVGVGPGAHGRVQIGGARLATVAAARPEAYIVAVAAAGVGWAEVETLGADAVLQEALSMGLRLEQGIDPGRFGPGLSEAKIRALTRDGVIETGSGRLRLTAQGRLVADRVISELAADL